MDTTMTVATRPLRRCRVLGGTSGKPATSATFSGCRRYRYVLERRWDEDLPAVLFIGLNPSTADEHSDDPTVRRCVRFARDWGYGSLLLANLFALRSTDPKRLVDAEDPVGRWNDRWLERLANRASLAIAAWGVHGVLRGRDQVIVARYRSLHCLGTTKEGHPRHPLYLRADTLPRPLPR